METKSLQSLLLAFAMPSPWSVLFALGCILAGGIVTGFWIRQSRTERALRRSEQRFRLLYERVPLGYQSLDSQGRFVEVNQAWLDTLGYRRDEVIGHWFGEFLAPESVPRFQERFPRFKEAGEVNGAEFEMQHKDGSRLLVSFDGKIGYTPQGEFQQTHCILANISERKRAEQALSWEARVNAALSGLSGLMIQSGSLDAIAEHVLSTAQELTTSTLGYVGYIDPVTGHLVSPTLTSTVWDQCEMPDKKVVFDRFVGLWGWGLINHRSLLTNDAPHDARSTGIPEGHLPIERFLSVPAMIDGMLVGQIALANPSRDYTTQDLDLLTRMAELYAMAVQRSRAEEALRASEDKFAKAFHTSPDSVSISRLSDGVYREVNQGFTDLTGYAPEEVIGKTSLEMDIWVDPADRVRLAQAIWQNGEVQGMEANFRMKDGGLRTALLSARLIEIDGEACILTITRNISERKQAEEALRYAEHEKETILDSLMEVVVHQSPDMKILWANRAACELAGVSRTELIGRSCHEVWDGQEVMCPECPVSGALRTYEPQFTEKQTRDGRFWHIRGYPVLDESGEIMGGVEVALDITVQKQAEEAERRHAERLEVLHSIDRGILEAQSLEAIADVAISHLSKLVPCMRTNLIRFDLETGQATLLAVQIKGKTQMKQEKYFTVKEFDRTGILAQGKNHLVSDLEQVTDRAPIQVRLYAEGVRSYLQVPLIAEGRLIGVINFSADQPNAFPPDYRTIGREVANQLAIAFHQFELRQQVERHTLELEERVAQRTAELQAANMTLERLSKMKDEFVSNVSHELRTPITNLKLRHHLLSAQPDHMADHLGVLRRETERLEKIVEDLLRLSRIDQDRIQMIFTPVDLSILVAHYVSDRIPMAESQGLTLTAQLPDHVPAVKADEGLLGQVLSVLLTNAFNYTPSPGRVDVTVLVDGAWAGFSVHDTGLGITQEDMPRLFERFFRGVAGYESGVHGTGLGLALVKEILDRHGGRVEVESDGIPGHGALFRVWLPIMSRAGGE